MTKNYFRVLIILHVLFIAAAIVVAFIPDMYSAALASAYNSEPESWIITSEWLTLVIIIPLLLISIISIIGLFFFKHWGRTLSLYSTVAITVISLSLGPSVVSALESTLLEISTLIWGAVLALAYYSPISTKFDNVSTREL